MKAKILFFFAGICILTASYGFYEYNRKPAAIATLTPSVKISADALIHQFTENQVEESKKHLNKLIQVRGKITAIEEGHHSYIILLNNGIKCELSTLDTNSVVKNQQIQLKGIYAGYDEMFNEISLVRCHLIK